MLETGVVDGERQAHDHNRDHNRELGKESVDLVKREGVSFESVDINVLHLENIILI